MSPRVVGKARLKDLSVAVKDGAAVPITVRIGAELTTDVADAGCADAPPGALGLGALFLEECPLHRPTAGSIGSGVHRDCKLGRQDGVRLLRRLEVHEVEVGRVGGEERLQHPPDGWVSWRCRNHPLVDGAADGGERGVRAAAVREHLPELPREHRLDVQVHPPAVVQQGVPEEVCSVGPVFGAEESPHHVAAVPLAKIPDAVNVAEQHEAVRRGVSLYRRKDFLWDPRQVVIRHVQPTRSQPCGAVLGPAPVEPRNIPPPFAQRDHQTDACAIAPPGYGPAPCVTGHRLVDGIPLLQPLAGRCFVGSAGAANPQCKWHRLSPPEYRCASRRVLS
mmetsp:Transcript_3248/g.7952  ORF Transcript_3248/g.7952 Transcript_3248/m.7952 type:complete len:335 (-) Transcript_3248:711-1715(-)